MSRQPDASRVKNFIDHTKNKLLTRKSSLPSVTDNQSTIQYATTAAETSERFLPRSSSSVTETFYPKDEHWHYASRAIDGE